MSTAEHHEDGQTSADENTEPPSSPVQRSPGTILMTQREALGLSVQTVANQLNLTMHFVRAIESDSHEKLPGDVFVRGYIRTYARLLKLDPEQVLAVYEDLNSHKIARKEEAIKRRDRRRKDRNRPWVLVSGIAFVGVAIALWYLNPDPEPEEETAAAITAGTIPNVPALNSPLVSASAAGNAPSEAVTETRPADEITRMQEPARVDESAPVEGSAPAEGSTPAQDSAPVLEAAPVAEPAPSPVSSGRTIMEYWPGTDELRLIFSAPSQAQVEHRGGSESHAETRAAGDTLVIRGTAPFSVVLDDARGVSLNFNNRQIDISSNIRTDNSARLSIGM